MRCAITILGLGISLVSSSAVAQQWVNQLPKKPQDELTVQDLKQAFNNYYEQHPDVVNEAKKQGLASHEVHLEGAQKAKEKEIEAYKLFKRWEWYAEPRTYPTGTWNYEKIDSAVEALKNKDDGMILNQANTNVLDARIQEHNVTWPKKFWKPLGPSNAIDDTNMGRVNSITFDPSNSKIIYIGTPDGGVWKTEDGGSTWDAKFDSQPTLSVGDVAIDPKDPKILYVATSDPFGYNVPFWGGTYSVGVRKSMDGGRHWGKTGLRWKVGEQRTIRRLVIHPTDRKILLAATSDGLFRTNDGGTTWKQILTASTYDAQFQPNDGNIAYATTTRVLKSTNGGASFTPLSATCNGTRYSLRIARSKPTTVYTLCSDAVVQKSINAGATWTPANPSGVTLYGYYDTVLAVSSVDANEVYVAGYDMMRTTNGGTTWTSVPVAGHVDNHCVTFFPGSGSSLLVGDDGGIFKSTNSGSTWTSLNKSLSITQFYDLGISKTDPAVMALGAQDNGNMKFNAGAFSSITGGDGMRDFVDWSNANTIYASTQYGSFNRSTNGGSSFTSIDTPSSGAWEAPWQQDPITANTIYAATDKVYKSVDQGTHWTAIGSPLAGGGLFGELKVAPSNVNYIYAGGGTKLYRTNNGGSTWADVTAGLPVATNFITDVDVSESDPNHVYVTFSGYNAGEKVYKSKDGGATWINISGGLPNLPADSIVHESRADDPLYVGTDAGVYYKTDHLHDWIPYKEGLPNVIVDHLEIHYGTKVIRAATYGRGTWEAPLVK
jgi:photosystem II stability/assembly factor-like uncharacterized protein